MGSKKESQQLPLTGGMVTMFGGADDPNLAVATSARDPKPLRSRQSAYFTGRARMYRGWKRQDMTFSERFFAGCKELWEMAPWHPWNRG